MHEGSIAAALVQSALEVREKEGLAAVKTVTVCIGRLHHVVPGLLQTAFRILKKETPDLARCRLVIEILPVRVACRDCGHETEIDRPEFACSACGSTAIDVTGGREMHLKEVVGSVANKGKGEKAKGKSRKTSSKPIARPGPDKFSRQKAKGKRQKWKS